MLSTSTQQQQQLKGTLSRITRVSQYQKGVDFTEARDSGSGISRAICHPTNSVKALKAIRC